MANRESNQQEDGQDLSNYLHHSLDQFPNERYLSPDGARTPPRILSSTDLAGEDIALSSRRSSAVDVELSPFTPSEETVTTPPSLRLPEPLSPPPLNSNNSGANNSESPSSPFLQPHLSAQIQPSVQSVSSSYKQSGPISSRPPRVPQHMLPPSNRGGATNNPHPETRHGRGSSNTDYSFLSALTESTTGVGGDFAPKRRTVSWDKNDPYVEKKRHLTQSPGALSQHSNTGVSFKSTPASLLQPILADENYGANRVTTPPRSIFTSPQVVTDPHPSTTRTSTKDVFRKLPPTQATAATALTASGDSLSNRDRSAPSQPNLPNWGGQHDTGSFVLKSSQSQKQDQLGLQTIQSQPGAPASSVPNEEQTTAPTDKRVTLQEVLDSSPHEDEGETHVFRNIEHRRIVAAKTLANQGQNNVSLLPHISDDRVHNFENTSLEDDQKTSMPSPDTASNSISKASPKETPSHPENLFDLTRRLEKASPGRGTTRHRKTQSQAAGDQLYDAATKLFANSTKKEDVELGNGGPGIDEAHLDSPQSPSSLQRTRRTVGLLGRKIKTDVDYFSDFVQPRMEPLRTSLKQAAKWLIFPCMGVACLLFYALDNPPKDHGEASASWWLIFVVRQIITLELGRLAEVIIIDFFIFRTKTLPRLLGPVLSLLIAQSKGWPFQLFAWVVFDFSMLFGDHRFAHHWLFWQNIVGLFNEDNPHGSVTSSKAYQRLLISGIGLSVGVSLKRYAVGQIVGKRIVRKYRGELYRLMKKLILISDVAFVSARLGPVDKRKLVNRFGSMEEVFIKDVSAGSDHENADPADSFDYSEAPGIADPNGNEFQSQRKMEIAEMLEEWEEPELKIHDEEKVDMSSILQFRKALNFIGDKYPFSPSFGDTSTREQCIECSQESFERLTRSSSDEVLRFETLCIIAKQDGGTVDRSKVKELIRLFRPNRSGQLTKLEFVKSVDSVYKELRLLLASIESSSQIDQAYEAIVNNVFYTVMAFIIMAVMGFDINALVLALSAFIVSFAFMIGTASSKYLEGILFVLVRKPFDIGDRIEISEIIAEPDVFGSSSTWIVEKVDLFTTTARLGSSREVATFANGSLADMRIINMRRSEKANVYIHLKFGVDTSTEQRETFRKRMTAFIKERPREWIKLVNFRCTRVEADLGFVEYVLIVQHRDAWQNVGAILQSKSDVFNHSLELQRELSMTFKAPRVPIDIRRFDPDAQPADHGILEDKKER